MKSFPMGSKMVLVPTSNCHEVFDVMDVNGSADGEKVEQLQMALEAGHYLKATDAASFIEHAGRLCLDLPEGFVYPPTVGQLASPGQYSLYDGRTAASVYRANGLPEMLVVLTPEISKADAIAEAARANMPAGIKRAQISKASIQKCIRLWVVQEGLKVTDIKERYGHIFRHQKLAFDQACREMSSNLNAQRVSSAAAEVTLKHISVKAAARNWDVSEESIQEKLHADVENEEPRPGFTKGPGNAVLKNLSKLAKKEIAEMESEFTREFLRGLRAEKSITEGLVKLRGKAEKVLELIAAAQRRFIDLSRRRTVEKAVAAAAGKPK